MKIEPLGPQGETTEVEAQSVFQETGQVPFNANRPQTVATTDPQDVLTAPGTSEIPRVEVSSGSRRANVENTAVPSPQDILSLISSKYLQICDMSTREDLNEFLVYMERMHRAVVVDVKPGSIIVMVECVSLEILEGVWEDYNSGHLNEIVQKFLVTEEILKAFGLAEVKLSTTIEVEDYKSCHKLLLKIAGMFMGTLQAAQAQYESTCGCIILKMAVNIKDLLENSRNRFEKINTPGSFTKICFALFTWCLLASCVVIFLIC